MNVQRLLAKLKLGDVDVEPLSFNHSAMEKLADQGVLHRKALADYDIGENPMELQGRMYLPTKPTDAPDDYLTARMGPDSPTHPRSVALHEQDHILQRGDFWDDRPRMMAWRTQNRGLSEGLVDDLLRTARSYSLPPRRTKFEEVATDLENSLALKGEMDHDMLGKEILADSGARLGKFVADNPRGQRTFDVPFLQELAVASTSADRPSVAIEAMKRRARRRAELPPTKFEQGTLEY